MRNVKMSKNIIKKGNLAFGMTKSQIICAIVACVVALATASGIFIFNWNVDLTMMVVFAEIIIIAGTGIVKINGMSFARYLFLLFFLADDVRLYSEQGVFNRYAKKVSKKRRKK